jgi:hypothetical protein
VNTLPLISASFPFVRYLDAYRFIDENRDGVMKVMIDVEHPRG